MRLTDESGFTLLELLLVITLVSTLYLVYATPKIVNIQLSAYEAQRDGTAAVIYDGLQSYFSDAVLNNLGTYPEFLDNAPVGSCVLQASLNDMCFGRVLQMGVTRDWMKSADRTYVHTPTSATYDYNETNGTFLCSAGC